jgi:hypothetical protein
VDDNSHSIAEIFKYSKSALEIWEDVRDIVDSVLGALAHDLVPFLSPDTRMEDSFVFSAMEMNQTNSETALMIQDELTLVEQIETVEIALTMLQRLSQSESELVQKIQESLSQFIQPSAHTALGDTKVAVHDSSHVLERWIAELETPYHMLDSLSKEITRMISVARQLTADAQYQRTIADIPKAELSEKWQQLLAGRVSVAEILKETEWSNEQIQTFRNFILSTAIRLECEVADLEKQELLEIAAELEDVGETLPEEKPFCLKISYPDPVGLWEEFEIRAWIRNDDLEMQVLDNFQIEGNFLSGMEIVSLHPPADHHEVDSEDGSFKADYTVKVASGESIELILRLRAQHQGNYSGEISVWNQNLDVSTAIPNIDVVHRQ